MEKLDAEAECQMYYAKWQEAKQRLEDTKLSHSSLRNKETELVQRAEMLRETIKPLARDRDKCKHLARHLCPELDVEGLI